jgi:2-dehydropantoate 2-reductase
MRIGIFGAGAIGGLMAVRLARAGIDVTVVARGPHLAAMQANGITLRTGGDEMSARPRCVADAGEAGMQDYVVVTLKAHGLPGAAPQIARMMGPDSALVTGINGVPYWYFHGHDSAFRDRTIDSVDPGGIVSRILPPACAIGCVVYPAAEVIEPGIVDHTYGDRFTLGEPAGTRTPRIEALSAALIAAGFKAPIRPRIRDEIWVKLWGNMAFNPISALTGATLLRLTQEPALRTQIRTIMLEGRAVAQALGVKFGIDVDRRIEGAADVGEHKTSMLQDLERGRPMEIDALLGAVVELGTLVGQDMPTSRTVLALVRERARQAGCYS